MICHLQKPCGWWNAAAFHQPLLSLSPTKNVNYTPKVLWQQTSRRMRRAPYFGGCNYSSSGRFRKCLTFNHLQSKHVRGSTSVNRLADRLFRENRPAAASKATFAKTIVLGNLHLPCPVLGTCRLVVLVVVGHRHKPKMAITLRKVPVQNGDRLPPDAALRLARRKRGNSLPRLQSASGLSSSDLERSVRVLA